MIRAGEWNLKSCQCLNIRITLHSHSPWRESRVVRSFCCPAGLYPKRLSAFVGSLPQYYFPHARVCFQVYGDAEHLLPGVWRRRALGSRCMETPSARFQVYGDAERLLLPKIKAVFGPNKAPTVINAKIGPKGPKPRRSRVPKRGFNKHSEYFRRFGV